MDQPLRCNSLKCRTELNSRAVVTTCSHIFCISCAESLGLATPNANARVCPACQTHLSNEDDAVMSDLNPSEDYKTSVLSGLHPTVIMECAARGMAFYTYQVHQEVHYQEYLAKSLTDKYQTLSDQMDKVIDDANGEIGSLRKKLEAQQQYTQQLEAKNQDLASQYRDKNRKHQKLYHQYQKMKQAQLAPNLETAADHDADNAIQAAAAGNFNAHQNHNIQPTPRRNTSRDSGGSGGFRQRANGWPHQVPGGRLNTTTSAPVPATPSGSRRLSMNGLGGNQMHGANARSPFQNIDPNIVGNGGVSYGGMSAGMKAPRGPINRNVSRVGGVGGFGGRY